MKRKELTSSPKRKSIYFKDEGKGGTPHFFSTGCTVLDCVMGYGYPVGRITNLVGDKSSGKTLLAIEAMANFAAKFPNGKIWYMETEAAFDDSYAEGLGFPIKRVDRIDDKDTVEDLFEILEGICKERIDQEIKEPALFIVDSLDALSDRSEKDREIDKGTYGTKAKQMSTIFRKLTKKLSQAEVSMIIVSQIRDNIGATFGRKTKRSGGRALDFYASIVIYLAEIKKRKKTSKGVQRVIGIDVRAKCDKNKVSAPFRECDFPITFDYGMEDEEACFEYLKSVKETEALKELGLTASTTIAQLTKKVKTEHFFKEQLITTVKSTWRAVEDRFKPSRRKYQ